MIRCPCGPESALKLLTLALCGLLLAAHAAAKDPEPLPLEGKTSSLAWASTEGSWVSVDVTPDGQHLVFDLLGDIYELPVGGGEARRLTQGLAYDSQPVVSPDGRWMAYISDRDGAANLWVSARDGGEPRQLSSEAQWNLISPEWSADSSFILATRFGQKKELLLFHREGGSGISLQGAGEDESPWGLGAVMDDDGRYIYYAGEADSERPVDNFPTTQIYRFDRHSGDTIALTQGIGGGVRPQLSPDERHLVYGTRHDGETGLRIRDLRTGGDRWLTWPVQRDAQEGYQPPSRDLLPRYDFTPDGRAIILNAEGGLWRVDIASGERTAVPMSAAIELQVGPDLTAPYRLQDDDFAATLLQNPQFSPDGATLVGSVLTRLYTMRTDGTTAPRELGNIEHAAFRPVWSPDGRWIAYVSWTDREGGQIWRVRSNGSGRPQQLTGNPAFYTDLVYSPSGEEIFALRGNAFQRQQTFSEFGGLRIGLELVALPAAGGELRVIGPAAGAREPHFGPAADRLYLSDDEGLFSQALDGSDRRREIAATGPRGNRRSEKAPAAESLRLSPDGRHVLAFAGKQLYVLPRLRAGGAPVNVNLRDPAIPAVRLTDTGADHYGWRDGGETIWWSIGNSVYARPLASVAWRDEDGGEPESENADNADNVGNVGNVGNVDNAVTEEGDAPTTCACGESTSPDEEKSPDDEDLTRLEDHEAVSAQRFNVAVSRDRPGGSLLLQNVALIAMEGETTEAMADIRPGQDVLITDGRIAATGPGGSLEIPAGTTVRDLAGRYLLPGFIDTHAHWEFRTDDVLEPHTWSLAANLAYGVTTGLDVQTFTEDYFAYRDMVESGQTIGQRALMTGPGIFGNTDFQSYAAAHAYLRRYSDHYRTHNIKAYLSGNRRQRQWIVLASQALGLLPTTEGGGDQRLDITHAIDGMHGNEHTLPDHPLGDDIVQLYARTGIAYTPTLIVQYNAESAKEWFFTRTDIHDDPKLRRFYPANRLDELTERRPGWQRDDEFRFAQAAADAARIQRAGGLLGVGGHAELQGLGYHWELWTYAAGGMTPAEILRAATIDGARIIGVADDLGSIAAGKLADLLVLEKNPLEDIRNSASLQLVIQNGRVYDAATLDQQWPLEKAFPPFWWWDAAAAGGDDTMTDEP